MDWKSAGIAGFAVLSSSLAEAEEFIRDNKYACITEGSKILDLPVTNDPGTTFRWTNSPRSFFLNIESCKGLDRDSKCSKVKITGFSGAPTNWSLSIGHSYHWSGQNVTLYLHSDTRATITLTGYTDEELTQRGLFVLSGNCIEIDQQ